MVRPILMLLFPALAFAADCSPGAAERQRILATITGNARSYAQALPNFLATRVTRRFLDPSGSGHGWHMVDTVEQQLSYFDYKETYTLVSVDGQPAKSGAAPGLSTGGEFGAVFEDIFSPQTEAAFQWKRCESIHGIKMYVFEYRETKAREWRGRWTTASPPASGEGPPRKSGTSSGENSSANDTAHDRPEPRQRGPCGGDSCPPWRSGLVVGDVPQVGAAVVIAGGERAARPEGHRIHARARGISEGGDDFPGGGVPQVRMAVVIAGGKRAARPEGHRIHARASGISKSGDDFPGGGVPQVRMAVVIAGGKRAARPEGHRIHARASGISKSGDDFPGGGVPQVRVAGVIAGGKRSGRPKASEKTPPLAGSARVAVRFPVAVFQRSME